MTLDTSAWYFGASALGMLVLCGVTLYAYPAAAAAGLTFTLGPTLFPPQDQRLAATPKPGSGPGWY